MRYPACDRALSRGRVGAGRDGDLSHWTGAGHRPSGGGHLPEDLSQQFVPRGRFAARCHDQRGKAGLCASSAAGRRWVRRPRGLAGSPERRFRFAGPCVEDGCPQWTGAGCAIADMAAEVVNIGFPASPRQLPACSIRHSCRWYFQRGPAACAACPLIVADTGGTDTYQSTRAEGTQ